LGAALSALTLISAASTFFWSFALPLWGPNELEGRQFISLDWIPMAALVTSFLAFVVSGIGTASTVILGWRSERRESKLKIAQLELQLAEARAKPASSEKPN
jgi:hypothetical protein